jgi:hypothetical protein
MSSFLMREPVWVIAGLQAQLVPVALTDRILILIRKGVGYSAPRDAGESDQNY